MNISEKFVIDELDGYDMPSINESVELIKKYRQTEFYASKQAILNTWSVNDKDIYELVISVFTTVLSTEYLTLQALVGKLNQKIKLTEELDRIKIMADIIGLISQTDLIDIVSQPGEYHLVQTDYFVKDIPEHGKHMTHTKRLKSITGNKSKELGHMVIGHAMNRHNLFIRPKHLDRMCQVALVLDQEFIEEYEESPKNWPDTELKEAQWELFKEKSTAMYKEVGNSRFYIPHKVDSRGRVYCRNYYLNYQGIPYKKAIIRLAHKEVVEGI